MQMEEVENINPYDDGQEKGQQVKEMFDSIAPAYDRMNSLMSFGLHRRWLRKGVRMVAATSPGTILDVATGTADVAIALARAIPSADITGIDLSQGMIDVGIRKVDHAGLSRRITLRQADCLALPFEDNSFDAVTVAYGVRNFQQLHLGYSEMLRVLRPGGMIMVIELSTPPSIFTRPFYHIYTRGIIPVVGRMMSRDSRAYSYLPESIAAVPQRERMCSLMQQCGFTSATFRPLAFGACTIYTAIKP